MNSKNKDAKTKSSGARACCWVMVSIFVVMVVGFFVFPYSGIYNVAATSDHTAVGKWFLETLKDHSIETRAGSVQVPENLYSESNLKMGYISFSETCVMCHGAPGVERNAVGKGITPEPPSLSEEGEEWTEAEIFWVLKHGIKLAGMPAFGPTHEDEHLWAVTAFTKKLPDLTSEEFKTFGQE